MGVTNFISPVPSSNRNDGQLGKCDSASNSSGHFFGALNTKSHMPIVVTHGNYGLEPCSLTGTGLFLNRHDFHDIVLQLTANEEINNFRLLKASFFINGETLNMFLMTISKLSTKNIMLYKIQTKLYCAFPRLHILHFLAYLFGKEKQIRKLWYNLMSFHETPEVPQGLEKPHHHKFANPVYTVEEETQDKIFLRWVNWFANLKVICSII